MGRQVDGTHYEDMPKGYQPFDIIKKLGLNYWQGSVLKYLLRAGKKPGVLASVDIRKAVHVLTEYAELLEAEEKAHPVVFVKPSSPLDRVTTGYVEEQTGGAGWLGTALTEPTLYRCPETTFVHDTLSDGRGRYIWHDMDGQAITSSVSGQKVCAFSGAYRGLTAEEARENCQGSWPVGSQWYTVFNPKPVVVEYWDHARVTWYLRYSDGSGAWRDVKWMKRHIKGKA